MDYGIVKQHLLVYRDGLSRECGKGVRIEWNGDREGGIIVYASKSFGRCRR